MLNDELFRVTGYNCYFLAYCSEENQRAVMASANTMGASVLRCWAFLDVDEFVPGQVAFQYVKNGKIVVNDGPDGLERLDRLIHVAEDMNIKLILPLVNHWADFGGMPMYVKWLAAGSDATEFYRSPVIR